MNTVSGIIGIIVMVAFFIAGLNIPDTSFIEAIFLGVIGFFTGFLGTYALVGILALGALALIVGIAVIIIGLVGYTLIMIIALFI